MGQLIPFLAILAAMAVLGWSIWFYGFRDPHGVHGNGHSGGHGHHRGHGHVEEVSETIVTHRRIDGDAVEEETCHCRRIRYPRFLHFIPGLEHGGLGAIAGWAAALILVTAFGASWWYGLIAIPVPT